MKSETILRVFLILCLLVSSLWLVFTVILYNREVPNLPTKAEVVDNYLNITFYADKTYTHPGETSTFYFEITNKKIEAMSRVDILLKVTYLGRVVYEREEVSAREFNKSETIKIETKEELPLTTPAGEYSLKFYIKPENVHARYLEYGLYVQPNIYQIVMLFSVTAIFAWLLYLDETENILKSFVSFIKRNFIRFTIGQKFVFMGIVVLIITAFVFASGLNSLANEFAIIAYFLLIIGVANNLLEYIKWGDSKFNYVLSMYVFSALVLLSIYDGISDLIGKTLVAFIVPLATFSFINLGKNQQRSIIGYLTALLFLWVILSLSQNNIPYYSIGLLLACIIYLSRKREVNF